MNRTSFKLRSVLCVLGLAALFQASAESLKVDFGTSASANIQGGYDAYYAGHENPSTFTTQSYSAFGATVSVTPSWASGAVAAAMQMIDRGVQAYEDATEGLMRDWIGTDTRSAGDPLTLTISGLPAGQYAWISYHHDTGASTMGQFDATVNDANGSATTTGIQITGNAVTTFSGVAKFTTTIVSDGSDITLVFDQQPYASEYNQAWFVMNGFEITNAVVVAPQQTNAAMRRPISPNQPMWLVHIDTWNYADPQKIIDLIPADIRPYVVFNISLSIGHDADGWSKFDDAYETAKSWLRTCAENRVWAIIQPSSGGYSSFSDYDLSIYEDFFREYPNFLGFNYCEQFWGFDDPPLSPSWQDRVAHWADLLELSYKYGGYLVVSWCGNQWTPSINPIAMLKRNPAFASACAQYTENFILCEKYTQHSYQSDMESLCLGACLSGYSGNYGIRYDSSGWSDGAGTNDVNFTLATEGAPQLEHMMLTGETVVDGPELIWQQCFYGGSTVTLPDGYSQRQWNTFSQFNNVSVDLFRKVLDGTVRIPTRQEVIDRTKVVVVNNVSSGSGDDIYSSPTTLFEGLYRMDGDGNLLDNKTFFKKTGRYPTIPTVFSLADAPAQSFQVQVNKSEYDNNSLWDWDNIATKTNYFNTLFPEEYTGDIYAGRHENGWVIYNPYKTTTTNRTASGSIPFKYNTCDHMDLTLSQYTAGVIKETATNLTFYLNNYDNQVGLGMRTDTIKIYGSTSLPTYTYTDRASHTASSVSDSWGGGVFTLTVQHNGPLDITLDCEGTATGRLTAHTPPTVVAPDQPMAYTGPLQYEGEFFDYKGIDGNVVNGDYTSPPPVANYTGQGYLKFGTSASAAVRDTVTVLKAGLYRFETKYSNTGAARGNIHLDVNGSDVATPVFATTPTYSDWAVNTQYITLNAGANTIEFLAQGTGASVYFDNIVVAPAVDIAEGIVLQENQTGFNSVDGKVDNIYAGYTGAGYANTTDTSGASIYWDLYFGSSVPKSLTFRYASTNARTANLFVNGVNVTSGIQFPSTGAWTNWDYLTVYPSIASGASQARLQAISATGLPNIDYVEVIGGGTTTTLPPAPTDLAAATGGSDQVNLTWTASSNATSYNIKRATVSGGPYTTIATGVVGTNYSDTGLAPATAYYYVASAANYIGESVPCTQVSATTLVPQQMLPIADAYVRDGWAANTAYGTSTELAVKYDGNIGSAFNRYTYLKFSVSGLSNVLSATLTLTPFQVDGAATLAYEVWSNDNWNEATITWNNQPAGSGTMLTNASGYAVGVPFTIDVKSAVAGQAANDGVLTIRISEPSPSAIFVGFWSRESTTPSVRPTLEYVLPQNTAPTLAAISDRTIGAGVTLAITNSATDSDVPAQTLTYSLLSAPANAAINADSGVITWRPWVTQANTTNPFTVRVADNGAPSLSATQSFTVTVSPLAQPQVSSIGLSGGQMVLQVSGDSGPDYQIQSSTNLVDWSAVSTTSAPLMPFAWTNNNTDLPRNFFRVLVGPPLP